MATVSYKLAPNFIHYFRKANGEPLTTDGFIYSYKDTDHNTPKPIYQDPDGKNAYANPLPIDSAGSVNLMYFADDEQYYIELYDGLKGTGGQLLASFEHFPDEALTPDQTEHGERNFILNPEFLKLNPDKLTFETADLPDSADTWIAYEGWTYRRNNTNATNSIKFKEFTAGQTNVPDNPQYYLEFECTAIGGGSEDTSDILLQLPNVAQFSGEAISFAVYLESQTSSSVELVIKQNFGSGGSAENIQTQTIGSDPTFNQYKIENFEIDSVSGKDIRDGNYIAIGLRMPLNAISIVKMTKFQFNKGTELLPYDYKTFSDESINSRALTLPDLTDDKWGLKVRNTGTAFEFDDDEVGDYIQSDKTTRTGYLLCDGSSYAAADNTPDGYVTYERLWSAWENDANLNGNMYGYGDDGFWPAGIYTDNIIFINTKESTNITDWTDFNTGFTFTKIHDGGDTGIQANKSGIDLLDETEIDAYVNPNQILFVNKSNGNVTDATAGTTTFTVAVKQQGTAGLPETTLVNFVPEANITGGQYFLISSTTTDYYVWYKKAGAGSDPAVASRTGILVELPGIGSSAASVAEITRKIVVGSEGTRITTVAASSLSAGQYFRFYNSTIDYVGYITIDGVGTDPEVASTTSIEIPLSSSDTAAQVAVLMARYIRKVWFQVPDRRGMIIRMTDGGRGFDPDTTNRYLRGDSIEGDNVGTWQRDQIREHIHGITGNHSSKGAGGGDRIDTNDHIDKYTLAVGGNETRMVNIYTNYFIKY